MAEGTYTPGHLAFVLGTLVEIIIKTIINKLMIRWPLRQLGFGGVQSCLKASQVLSK